MLAWRKDSGLASIKEEVDGKPLKQSSFPHFELVLATGDNGPWYHACSTNETGHVVHLEVVGKSNPTELVSNVPYQKIFEYQVGYFEARARILHEQSSADQLIKTFQIRDLR